MSFLSVWWIGANDLEVEGQFRWEYSLETIGFASWLSPDPNNHKNKEHCVLTNWGKTKKWVDAPCDWKKNYVCQKPLTRKNVPCKKGGLLNKLKSESERTVEVHVIVK